MPEAATRKRAARDRREGKSASTQAGEYVKQEMDHIREGKHGAKSARQAIAIGLSEARRAGIDIPDKRKKAAPKRKSASRRKASSTSRPARKSAKSPRKASTRRASHARRSRATTRALKRMPRRAASHRALSRQAHAAARRRSPTARTRANQAN